MEIVEAAAVAAQWLCAVLFMVGMASAHRDGDFKGVQYCASFAVIILLFLLLGRLGGIEEALNSSPEPGSCTAQSADAEPASSPVPRSGLAGGQNP